MHYIYKNGYINDNQYGFTPQKSTTDAAMVVKEFLEPELVKGKVAIMVSLDVKGAFNSVWWPAILKGLTFQRGELGDARHSENEQCRGKANDDRHAARSHSLYNISTTLRANVIRLVWPYL
jgi:hypothetical protein